MVCVGDHTMWMKELEIHIESSSSTVSVSPAEVDNLQSDVIQ